MKPNKKINPYEKKKVKHRRITRKQRTAILCVAVVVALLASILVVSRLARSQNSDDPHAGHNHAPGEDCNTVPTGDSHNHGENTPDTGALTHHVHTNADGTYRLQVTNKQNKVVFEKDKLFGAPIKETVSDSIFSLGWATGKGANDFEHIFCHKDSGAVSALFYAPRGCDGTRVAYSSADQTKIIVQDIFDKDTYYKEYPLADVYTKGDTIIMSGKLQADKSSVLISYVADEKGAIRQTIIKLYE